MKVDFIGLGQMGNGMAAILVRAGHEVTRSATAVVRSDKQAACVSASALLFCQGEARCNAEF